jgi:hypothetical protein
VSALRAERRTGELLRDTAAVGQRQAKADGRPEKASSSNDTSRPTLRDLGITRDQFSDWQKLAAIPVPTLTIR